MADFLMGIVTLSISVIFLSSVFIQTVKDQNTSSWTATEVTLWGLLTIAGIVGLVMGTLNLFGVA